MLRGQNEGFLTLDLEIDPDAAKGESPAERACGAALNAAGRGAGDQWLREAAAWAVGFTLASPVFVVSALSYYSMPAHLLCNVLYVLLLLRKF